MQISLHSKIVVGHRLPKHDNLSKRMMKQVPKTHRDHFYLGFLGSYPTNQSAPDGPDVGSMNLAMWGK